MASLQIKPAFLWSAGIIWPTACTAVVSARLITRKAQGIRYGWDDWLVIPAWVLTCALSAILLVGVAEKAMGYPTPVIAPELSLISTSREQTITRKIFWVTLLLHTPALTFIKLSCIAFYHRVFRTGHSRTTDILLFILMALVTGWGISFTVTTLFTCGSLKHLDYLWTSLENQMKCTVDVSMWQRAMAISDVIMDLMLLVFPMPYIWRLNMERGRKLGLIVIFLFGSLSIAASTMRLVILLQALDVEFQAHIDQDFLSTAAAYFMLLEAGFGIVAVCLPALAGAMHLKGIQTFFANISQMFSIRSQASHYASDEREINRGASWKSDEELAYDSSKTTSSDTHTEIIALRPLSHSAIQQDGVHITKTVELTKHEMY